MNKDPTFGSSKAAVVPVGIHAGHLPSFGNDFETEAQPFAKGRTARKRLNAACLVMVRLARTAWQTGVTLPPRWPRLRTERPPARSR